AKLALFGPEPEPFYAVQLAEIALTAAALFLTLGLCLPRAAAATAALLFITGPPICTVATQLMLMHYLESIFLAIVSAALFTIGMRRNGRFWDALSALTYLGAMLAKEIAVPLPLVLLVLPEND